MFDTLLRDFNSLIQVGKKFIRDAVNLIAENQRVFLVFTYCKFIQKNEEILDHPRFAIEPVTEDQARIAREAYRDFGKGSGHPAKLNFGDCFAYALAKAMGEALLFKGDDFPCTDIPSALG